MVKMFSCRLPSDMIDRLDRLAGTTYTKTDVIRAALSAVSDESIRDSIEELCGTPLNIRRAKAENMIKEAQAELDKISAIEKRYGLVRPQDGKS